jgi:hypothetical protein
MAAVGGGAAHGGRRGALPRGLGRVASGGEAKRTSRCPQRPSRAQMVVDAPWTRSTSGVRGAAAETEKEMEVGTYLQFLRPREPLSKLEFSLFSRVQMKKC